MPDILTHIAFAHEVLDSVSDDYAEEKEEILKRINLLNLGAQGPDLFFYFKPFKKKNPVGQTGEMLHAQKTGSFLEAMLYSMENYRDIPEKYWNAAAYTAGFICHYYLDKKAHPFIYAHCGYHFEDGREMGKNIYEHRKMECIIDAAVWQMKKGKNAFSEPVHKSVRLENGVPEEVSAILAKSIKEIYMIQISGKNIQDSLKGLIKVCRLLFDPFNIKKNILKAAERLASKEIRLPKRFYPADLSDAEIYMNREKNKWTHPLNKNIVFDCSFDEIYNQSRADCTEALNVILYNVKEGSETFKEIFGNDSYLTNFDCESEENKAESIGEGILKVRAEI